MKTQSFYMEVAREFAKENAWGGQLAVINDVPLVLGDDRRRGFYSYPPRDDGPLGNHDLVFLPSETGQIYWCLARGGEDGERIAEGRADDVEEIVTAVKKYLKGTTMNNPTQHLFQQHQAKLAQAQAVAPAWFEEFEQTRLCSAEECEALAVMAPTEYTRAYLLGRAIEHRMAGRIREKVAA